MPVKPEEQPIQLNALNLKDIIAAAIAESKRPSELEQLEIDERKEKLAAHKLQVEEEQRLRRESALEQLQLVENKRTKQRLCSHQHRKGDTHCVFINDELGGYILCQKCQAVIRPGEAPKTNPMGTIYNTDLFNKLFQQTSSNGVWE